MCARIGREADDINVGQFCCGGLNFGYFYAASPIIAYDGEPAPAYNIYEFRQSTVPGCRTPHLWPRDGKSLYDVLRPDFALLRFDVDVDEAAALFPQKLLLSRPDQHVAWRGDKPPHDPLALIDQVRGAPSRHHKSDRTGRWPAA